MCRVLEDDLEPLLSRTVVYHGERDPLLESNRLDPSMDTYDLII